ncbi:MAG TPA: PfkB family carbohydrate kinase [Vicinamibacteria bacterium]|nr:PfkB family carbohydrate kinase [Vicinamibacteria bacterium]
MGAPLSALASAPYARLVGVGGIGTGMFFALEGVHDLGRNESRPARLLDVRDYCKLHIVAHYVAVLLGARPAGDGFQVLPLGRIGDDEAGRRVRQEMSAAGMDVRFVLELKGRPTTFSVCFQYPDGSGGNITTSDSASAALRPAEVEAIAGLVDARTIALAAPEVPLETRHALLRLAGARGALRVAALATAEVKEARRCGMLGDIDLLALNADEAAAVAGRPFPSGPPEEPFLASCASELGAGNPRIAVVVTAGRRGAWALEGGRWTHTPALEVRVASTAGAGDALLGATVAGLAAGLPLTSPGEPRQSLAERPLESAVDLGVLLSAFTVTSPHTIHPGAAPGTLAAFAREHGVPLGDGLTRLLQRRGAGGTLGG